jgi:hypothetical protein
LGASEKIGAKKLGVAVRDGCREHGTLFLEQRHIPGVARARLQAGTAASALAQKHNDFETCNANEIENSEIKNETIESGGGTLIPEMREQKRLGLALSSKRSRLQTVTLFPGTRPCIPCQMSHVISHTS